MCTKIGWFKNVAKWPAWAEWLAKIIHEIDAGYSTRTIVIKTAAVIYEVSRFIEARWQEEVIAIAMTQITLMVFFEAEVTEN